MPSRIRDSSRGPLARVFAAAHKFSCYHESRLRKKDPGFFIYVFYHLYIYCTRLLTLPRNFANQAPLMGMSLGRVVLARLLREEG